MSEIHNIASSLSCIKSQVVFTIDPFWEIKTCVEFTISTHGWGGIYNHILSLKYYYGAKVFQVFNNKVIYFNLILAYDILSCFYTCLYLYTRI